MGHHRRSDGIERCRRHRQWWRPRPPSSPTVLQSLVILLLCCLIPLSSGALPREVRTSFSEGAVVGTRKLLDVNLSRDLDPARQPVTAARVAGGDPGGVFALETTRSSQNRSRVSFLHLATRKALDRERQAEFRLTAQLDLYNGDSERFQLLVRVLDINDNPPVFEQDRYAVTVNRSLAPNSQLLRVRASDSDEGKNARLTYQLGQSDKLLGRHFTVGRDDGVLMTRAALSCVGKDECPKCLQPSSGEPCSLLVYAKDGGSPQQSSYTVVKVSLLQGNEHDPKITIRHLPNQQEDYSVVTSTSKSGTSVAAITVSDPDPGNHGKIASVDVVGGNGEGNFKLERIGGGGGKSGGGNVYLVRVAPGARLRRGQRFNLKLQASDAGDPQRTSRTNIQIRVEDKNEFKPEFEQTLFTGEISESAPVGTSVVIVRASDADQNSVGVGGNSILYSIVDSDPPHKWFRLHPYSGLITVASPDVDRETAPKVTLRVKAQDGGGDNAGVKSSFATVEITLRDANDVAPEFTRASLKNVSLSESAQVGAVVHKVEAEDADEGDAGRVVYRLKSGGDFFDMDESIGEITLKSVLDREETSDIEVEVQASDLGEPPLSSSLKFVVTVLDVNDNSPTFYPTKQVISLKKVKASGVVFTAHAMDGDEGEAGRVTYSWQDPSEVPPFLSLNSSSGEVEARRNRRTYEASVKITASDGDGKKSISSLELMLVKDLKHLDAVQIFEVEEDDDETGRNVGVVDRKGEADGGTFEILDGDPEGILSIHPQSGAISANEPLDREAKSSYDLQILYSAPSDAYVVFKASLKVLDKNDNAPSFDDDSSVADIVMEADAPLGAPVYRVPVTDMDEGDNGRLEFRLDDPDDDLAVDAETGVVYLKSNVHKRSTRRRMVEVTVMDHGRERLSARRKYRVTHRSGNRHTPAFNFDRHEISVSESTPLNTRVLSLPAADADEGADGAVSYSLTGGDPVTLATFGVLPGGDVYLLGALDREARPGYAFTVVAEDGGNPARSSSTSVVIRVTDENDNAPRFDLSEYAFELTESPFPSPSSDFEPMVIGQVSASDPDLGRNAELTFSLAGVIGQLGGSSPVSRYLSLDAATGLVTSVRPIDREKLVAETGQDYFQFDVIVEDAGTTRLSDTATVVVSVRDANDNAPRFSQPFYAASVSESARLGQRVEVEVAAADADAGDNGRVIYSLVDGAEDAVFDVDPVSGSVFVTGKLDRERTARYDLLIRASDSGRPSLSSTSTLAISVTDENDNSPAFAEAATSVKLELSEDIPAGEVVHVFKANDVDDGVNGKITYSMAGGGVAARHFYLDPLTGSLILRSQLDRETSDGLALTVTASDGGNPARSATVAVAVNVLDVNDNSPAFPGGHGAPDSPLVITVAEDVRVGTVISRLEATDSDQGENGRVAYAIQGHHDESFSINSKTGALSTTKQLDREMVEKYEFVVIAQDGGSPARKTKQKIQIVVEDVNDSAPRFHSSRFAVVMPGSSRGTTVSVAAAEDDDALSNGEVTYELEQRGGGSEISLDIDRQTGRIFLASDAAPFFEPDSFVAAVATVKATDGAAQAARLTSTATVTVLGGRADPGPEFTQETYRVSVRENSPEGTPVGKVALVGDDSRSGGRKPEFYLVGSESRSGRDRGLFEVDKETGQVRTAGAIDREMEGDKIVLNIIALFPNSMSTCKIEVTCLDENDTAPKFNLEEIDLRLSEAYLSGHVLGSVTAGDADSANSDGGLTYSLGAEAAAFMTINERTGTITLKEPVDRELQEEVDVEVKVTDGIHTEVWRKTLQVEDVNDNAPIFEPTHFSFDVPETATRGAVVGCIHAEDTDAGAFSRVSYRLVSEYGSDTFHVEPTSGLITLAGPVGGSPNTAVLDHEKAEHYVLVASASDGGSPPLTSTSTVYINVVDVNDNDPQIEKALYSVSVPEDADIGTFLENIAATDADSVSEGQLVFQVEEPFNKLFAVKPNGDLVTVASLDRESDTAYAFKVTVSDDGGDKENSAVTFTSSCTVEVTVVDVNDEVPTFDQTVIYASAAENAPPGTPFTQVSARDGDEGRNAEIHYLLEDSHGMRFSVGRIDGVLRSEASLDRETQKTYQLSVVAMDNGTPRLTSRVDIIVNVEDANDNPPSFNPKFYTAQISENASLGMHVVQTRASDRDDDARVRYLIVSGDPDGDFGVGAHDGLVHVARRLDYERRNSYRLVIRAEDSNTNAGSGKGADTATVVVTVEDVNDNPPRFPDAPYFCRVRENAPSTILSSPIFVASAIDRDDPPFDRVEYSLRDSIGGLFNINASTGEVFATRSLDRESVGPPAVLRLHLIAQDFGSPRLTAEASLDVHVDDENDMRPEFEATEYHLEIAEDAQEGQSVGRVSAVDQDEGLNAQIRYTIKTSKGDLPFSVNGKSGEILVSGQLDREALSSYSLELVATDSSPFNPLSSSATVIIDIKDVNDNSPTFFNGESQDEDEPDERNFFVSPETRSGDFILGLFARDLDDGSNGQVTFSISGRDAKNFKINPISGVVTASTSFRTQPTYSFLVTATDGGGSSGRRALQTTEKVEVFLANEFTAPRFGRDFVSEVEINEDAAVGATIATLTAEGAEDNLAFGLAGGNTMGWFAVDENTGEVIVKRQADYEMMKEEDVWVKVYHRRKPLFFSAKKMLIKLKNVNDNPPRFHNSLIRVTVPEEQYPPFHVAEVRADDLDEISSRSSSITYKMGDDSEDFAVDEDTGEVTCLRKLDREAIGVEPLRALIVASDGELSSTATVVVWVEDINDNAPLFARLYSVNVTEATPVGSVLLTIETRDADTPPNAQVTYTVLSNEDQDARLTFDLDEKTGDLTLREPLDREVRDEYILEIEASDGAWKLDTVVTISVRDENDNAPNFDHDKYFFNITMEENETVGPNFFVGKVQALDRDSIGPNSEIVYSLAQSAEFFGVDESSGSIRTTKSLPHISSTNEVFRLVVVASDLGSPSRSSQCSVEISLIGNEEFTPDFVVMDSPKALTRTMKPGVTVMKFQAKDDLSRQARFKIVGGNGTNFFDLDLKSGRLALKRGLFSLSEGSITSVNVSLSIPSESKATSYLTQEFVVTGENVHSPAFQSPTTRVYIREDEPVGNTIISLTATDKDEGLNGEVVYEIVEGNLAGHFEVDRNTGKMTIKKALDFEKQMQYNLVVVAADRGFESRSARTEVNVVLQDVNDNAPEFIPSSLLGYIKENSKPGTLVAQVNTTDPDSPKFAVVEYKFVGDDQSNFEIDSKTGMVMALRSFDYEKETAFSLMVQASNPGSDEVVTAPLNISVVGENEFVPRFVQPVIQFAISESSGPGTAVGTVLAEDADAGPEGEVQYFLVGSSNAAGFVLDRLTGVINVDGGLDRESQNRYVLRVMAKNRGPIRGGDIDEAQVIVQVRDGNDPPIFRRPSYHAEVREDAAIGSSVATVSAVDKDIQTRNSLFSYAITEGDGAKHFAVDPSSGLVTVASKLDRESIPAFNITISAIDTGSPPATGTAVLFVTLDDVNDSPPALESTSGEVKENSPKDSFVAKLIAVDPDLPPNAGPFTFELLPSPEAALFSLDRFTGVLKSSVVFDRERQKSMTIEVRVSDAGRPPRSAVFPFKVDILDENDNPSSPRALQVVVKVFEGTFAGGELFHALPTDPDEQPSSTYRCQMANGQPEGIFRVASEGCRVTAGRIQNAREYDLAVLASDGRHPEVEVQARLNFSPFSRGDLGQAVPIHFANVTEEDGESVLGVFERLTNGGMGASFDLLSLNQANGSITAFLAMRENGVVLPRTETVQHLRSKFKSLATEHNAVIGYSPCDDSPCQNGGSCSSSVALANSSYPNILTYGDIVFNSPAVVQSISCSCSEQFSGDRCEEQRDPCDPNPCLYNAQCVDQSNAFGSQIGSGKRFQCLCPPLRSGDRCELESADTCRPNPCLNGGTCKGSKTNDFFCLCRPGYRGARCESVVDSCASAGSSSNPCLNGGDCIPLVPGYKCRCPDNFYGVHCELSTMGFSELSHVTLPALAASSNDVSVVFTTTKRNALLLYNRGERLGNGRSDFFAVELVSGRPRFSWGGARSEASRITIDRDVATGRWFKLTATRHHQIGTLSLEDCTESGEYCKTCEPDDPSCFKKITGEAGTLSFHGNPLHFGGLPSASEFLSQFDQISSDDFVGCVKSLSLDGLEKNILNDPSVANRTGVSDTCNQAEGGACGIGNECGSYGVCVPLWNRHQCRCDSGPFDVLSSDCDASFAPISLTDDQRVVFAPSQRYVRSASLLGAVNYQDEDQSSDHAKPTHSLSLSFRTLVSSATLLTVKQDGSSVARTVVEIVDGVLGFFSDPRNSPTTPSAALDGGLGVSSAINMSSGVRVDDGQWHNVALQTEGPVLKLWVDGTPAGYELESSAVHDFLGADVSQFILGEEGVRQGGEGFRGCLSNFTVMGELQKLSSVSAHAFLRLSSAPFSSPSFATGCDIQILQSSQPRSAVDVGVIVIIVFFVLLICAICISFTWFKIKKREEKKANSQELGIKASHHQTTGFTNSALDLNEQQGFHSVPLNNVVAPQQPQPQSRYPQKAKMRTPHQPQQRPDLLGGGDLVGASPYRDLVNQSPAADHLFPENAEHYDIENASSIAPSDIDVVYHYKGYRDGGGASSGARYRRSGGSKSLTGKGKRNKQALHATPLARLSPSSEMSHNPRILTLGDLSGKSLPPGLLVEQSERSLNSPVSHVSSNVSRHSHHHSQQHRGLTSENVARFNSQSPHHHHHHHNGHKSPSLLNSLDVLQSGAGGSNDGGSSSQRRNRARSNSRFSDRKTPLSHGGGDGASSSSTSSSDAGDDDSFTCSEYEYDGSQPVDGGVKDTSAVADGMVFSKLASSPPPPPPPPVAMSAGLSAAESSADESGGAGDNTSPLSQGKTWESLLSWTPDYASLSGVFRDIAELPHVGVDPDPVCRPSPLGDHRGSADEQYI